MPGFIEGLTTLFQNPDFLQLLAGTGTGLSQGQSFGEAGGNAVINASKNIAGRNAYQEMFKELRGDSPSSTPTPTGELKGSDAGLLLGGQPLPDWLQKDITTGLTPKGAPGLDAYNVQHTADGSTITMKSSSPQNRNTYGTNVPMESQSTQSKVPPQGEEKLNYANFFQALLGQE